jgi:hypothetical protein
MKQFYNANKYVQIKTFEQMRKYILTMTQTKQ